MVPLVPAPKPPKPPQSKQCFAFAIPTTLQLSRVAMSRLRQRAEATGMTEAELVTTLIEMIAQDDLYDAVLDTAKNRAKISGHGLAHCTCLLSRLSGRDMQRRLLLRQRH